mgnify:CR=1 FL=1
MARVLAVIEDLFFGAKILETAQRLQVPLGLVRSPVELIAAARADRPALIIFDLNAEKGYNGWGAYSNSKLMNVLFTFELARRLEGTGVTANCLHPGFVATQFGKNNGGLIRWGFDFAQQIGAISPQKGAETTIYLAVSPDVETVTGKYFDQKKTVEPSRLSQDEETARRLWEVSLELTGLKETIG